MATGRELKLYAEDPKDLEVISAAVQDSVTKAGSLRYQARRRRFSIELNRYRWEVDGKQRTRSIFGIDGVLGVRARGFDKADPELVLSILKVSFNPGEEAPGGVLMILFAGDGELAIEVECLDVTLLDGHQVWPTKKTPSHKSRTS